MIKVVFMGTPDYATQIFQSLLACPDIELPLLITQPDKPVGRRAELRAPHIKAYVLGQNIDIEIYQPETLKNSQAYERISSFRPDFIVVAAYGQILPQNILDIAPCINLHASLLPRYRGASPIQSAILHADAFAGVSAMKMQAGLDCGEILGLAYLKLDADIKVEALFAKLSLIAGELAVKTLWYYDTLLALEQKDCDSSYAKKIQKSDGLVSFGAQSARDIYTKFRAYDPWPGIFLESGLKLKNIELADADTDALKGEIVRIDTEVVVACKSGFLSIKRVQPASKKEMDALEYIRGKRLQIGNYLA